MATSTVVDLKKKRTEILKKTIIELFLRYRAYHYDVMSRVTQTLLDDGILTNYPINLVCGPPANSRIVTDFQTNYHGDSVPVTFIRIVDKSGRKGGQDIYKVHDDEISLVVREIINDPKYSDLVQVEVFKRLLRALSNSEVVCFSNLTTRRDSDGEITVFSFDVLIHNQRNTVSVYPGNFIR